MKKRKNAPTISNDDYNILTGDHIPRFKKCEKCYHSFIYIRNNEKYDVSKKALKYCPSCYRSGAKYHKMCPQQDPNIKAINESNLNDFEISLFHGWKNTKIFLRSSKEFPLIGIMPHDCIYKESVIIDRLGVLYIREYPRNIIMLYYPSYTKNQRSAEIRLLRNISPSPRIGIKNYPSRSNYIYNEKVDMYISAELLTQKSFRITL